MVAGVARGQPLVSVLLGTELPLVLGLLYCGRGGGAAVPVALIAALLSAALFDGACIRS